jgi:hypothetical protein
LNLNPGINVINYGLFPVTARLNFPVSKILRFTGTFMNISIPYAMKLCPLTLIKLAPARDWGIEHGIFKFIDVKFLNYQVQ